MQELLIVDFCGDESYLFWRELLTCQFVDKEAKSNSMTSSCVFELFDQLFNWNTIAVKWVEYLINERREVCVEWANVG